MAKLQVQNFAKIPNQYVLVERSRGLTMLEEKLVYMLINSMQKRYESTKKLDIIDYDYIAGETITVDEFCKTMEIGSKDYGLLRKSLFALYGFSLAVHENTAIRFIHLFDEFVITKDDNAPLIKYTFHKHFLHYFTGICKDYFNLEVQEVISLNSSHAIRIYQLLKSKLNMTTNEHVYTVQQLKQLLNIENKYPKYNNLKVSVLDVAKEQINASAASKFLIDYEEIKTGKAVTSIKLIIRSKEANYYVEKNLIAKYKIDQIKKSLTQLLKHESSVVRLLAEKINHELKYKKPSRAVIANYLDAIKKIAEQSVPEL